MFDVADDELPNPADIQEAAASEFKLNSQQKRIMEYAKANIPISGFAELLTEELWLREVLKDVDSPNPYCRTRALSMLQQYLGIGGKGKKKNEKIEVDFQ